MAIESMTSQGSYRDSMVCMYSGQVEPADPMSLRQAASQLLNVRMAHAAMADPVHDIPSRIFQASIFRLNRRFS
ncbi:hypothetical protein [Noviherbaspirillum malthae]|jgi:hypothetical protein|uniref:hypothetical protein n=1 Tax=Noviherbaspirillum malthae TaxID=1260987 RepID=UPI00188DE305|nr:hypothetical protein [Noviherbaspirillum malthae]